MLTAKHVQLVGLNKALGVTTLFQNSKKMKSLKDKFQETLHNLINESKMFLEDLFPSLLQKKMLDYVLFNTSATGIQSISTPKLMDKFSCSMRTVRTFVNNLKTSNFFEVARISKTEGGVGTYIFILKAHDNYPRIMSELFGVDVVPLCTSDCTTDCTTEKPVKPLHSKENETFEAPILSLSLSTKKDLNNKDYVTHIKNDVDNRFIKLLKNYRAEDEMNTLWNVVEAVKRHLNLYRIPMRLITIALNEVFGAVEQNKIKKDKAAFFFGVLKNVYLNSINKNNANNQPERKESVKKDTLPPWIKKNEETEEPQKKTEVPEEQQQIIDKLLIQLGEKLPPVS